MEKKYLLLSLDDERAKELAKVLGNKTCKKILDSLTEKELSEKDISDELKLPINTIEYNLKKLIKAELIEKSKTFFWSKKGKKIPTYKISNKSIIISPKKKLSSKLKSILPAVILSGIGAVLVQKLFTIKKSELQDFVAQETILAGAKVSREIPNTNFQDALLYTNLPSIGIWFLAGAIFALFVIVILNWKKI